MRVIKCPECGEQTEKAFLSAHVQLTHRPIHFRKCSVCGEKGHTLFKHSVAERIESERLTKLG